MLSTAKIILVVLFSLTLTSCGIPHGESIEDCRTMSQCYYHDKSVRTEGSEMSNELKTLILYEEDDIVFYYSRNPVEEYVVYKYNSSDTLTHESIDEISNVLIDIVDVVNSHYVFDEIRVHIMYGNTDLEIVFDDNNNIRRIFSRVDISTYKSVDGFSEEEIIANLEENSNTVKLLIDYFDPAYITWFGIGDLTVVTEDDSITIRMKGGFETPAIRLKIEELLDGYNIIFD